MEVHPAVPSSFSPPAPSNASTSSSHTRLPNSTRSSAHHKSHNTNSSSSVFSQPWRASSSTQHTSSSTLWTPTSFTSSAPLPPLPLPPNGTVSASNNVINRVADKSTSLFQFCRILRIRLTAVPGFEDEARWTEAMDEEDLVDPVSLLWKTFRRGFPLLAIYNVLQPENPIIIQHEMFQTDIKREKAAVFKFLQACLTHLNFKQDECFIITDLFGEDTSGFVKVARLVSRVVDILEDKHLIEPVGDIPDDAPPIGSVAIKRTQRQHIVDELVRTERTYVQHLEVLHEFKRHVEQKSIIAGDAVHDIFLNLNALLDFQRRFLIRVEQINSLPEDEQDWGNLFITFGPGLRVYESYIANQKTCEETAMRNYEKLKESGGAPELQQVVESPTHLTAFLLKPFQRLSKYPLLLKELRNKGDLDEARREAIKEAISIIQSVLRDTNAYIAQQERAMAVRELLEAVDDWKNHQYESFGELLHYGAFLIQKGDVQQSDREYKLYLFENILLCCKDVTNKRNKLIPANKPPSVGPSSLRTKPKYTLKGRIYLFNLEDVITVSKPGESYMCKLSWLANPGIESLAVRFPSEEKMNVWRDTLLVRKRICREEQQRLDVNRHVQKDRLKAQSSSEFNYLADQGEMENPYKKQDDDNEDSTSRYGSKESLVQSVSNQGSSNSLRSRSTTGDSGPPPMGRPAHMKYPAGFTGAPLTLRTQQLQNNAVSPMDRAGNSYFSPIMDSPISSRTSSSSGMIPFPRQPAPPGTWPSEDSNRFTAPAPMTRSFQNGFSNSDGRSARSQHVQTLPAHPSSLAQTRLRSASSPDVHGGQMISSNAPPVPVVPSHLASQGAISRSRTGSPIYGHGPVANGPASNGRSTLREQTSVENTNAYDGYYDQSRPTSNQTLSSQKTFSPTSTSVSSSAAAATAPDGASILSFKIKVYVPSESTTFILVAGSHISYRNLRDRIDAKLLRCTNITMATGNLRLQFKDDGEMISIQTDEDVQTAFDLWRETHVHRDSVISSQLGEIEIFCTKVSNNVL